MRHALTRAWNSARKLAAGLRPHSESVWPGVRNDLFVAHESIYGFFARFCASKRVLDGGCGTGYGSALISKSGAESVVGVDLDESNIRYARRSFARGNLTFDVADLERLPYAEGSFDVIVSSNAMEHLHEPSVFVSSMRRILRKSGVAVIAVPPIVSVADVEAHRGIHYHRSNLSVDQWLSLFREGGFEIRCYSHRAREGKLPDFSSPLPSALTVDDFEFVETTRDGLYAQPSITALFELA